MVRTIRFTVLGKAAPGGTVRPVPIKRGGQVVYTTLAPGRDKNEQKRMESWRQDVASAAAAQFEGELLMGAIEVEYIFIRPRPRDHFGTGRNSGKVKPSADAFPIKRPDGLKLARLTEDALTGVVWHDDSQVVEHRISKRFGSPERCEVVVRELVNEIEVAA